MPPDAPVSIDLSTIAGPWQVIALTGATGAGSGMNVDYTVLPTLANGKHQWANGTKTISAHSNGDWLVKSGSTVLYRKIGSKPWPWSSGAWTGENSGTGTLALARKTAVPATMAFAEFSGPFTQELTITGVTNPPELNDTLPEISPINGRRAWQKTVEGYTLSAFWDGDDWVIQQETIATTLVFLSSEDVATPDLVTTWIPDGMETGTPVVQLGPFISIPQLPAAVEIEGSGPPAQLVVTGTLTDGTNPVAISVLSYLDQFNGRPRYSDGVNTSVVWADGEWTLTVQGLDIAWRATADVVSPELVPAGGWTPVAPATGTPIVRGRPAPPVSIAI